MTSHTYDRQSSGHSHPWAEAVAILIAMTLVVMAFRTIYVYLS